MISATNTLGYMGGGSDYWGQDMNSSIPPGSLLKIPIVQRAHTRPSSRFLADAAGPPTSDAVDVLAFNGAALD
jgi:hypothetical protein